jgi:hypothetical protein
MRRTRGEIGLLFLLAAVWVALLFLLAVLLPVLDLAEDDFVAVALGAGVPAGED